MFRRWCASRITLAPPVRPRRSKPPRRNRSRRAPPPETAEAAGPLRVAVPDAILLALQNNRAFIVDRYNVPITRTAEQQQLAAFDPDLTGTFSLQRAYDQVNGRRPRRRRSGCSACRSSCRPARC